MRSKMISLDPYAKIKSITKGYENGELGWIIQQEKFLLSKSLEMKTFVTTEELIQVLKRRLKVRRLR